MRTNEQIRISPIFLVDETDTKVGVTDTFEAIRRARSIDMDLVEVAPHDRPPVCRIMDYGKWKYRQNKKEQKSHQKHHAQQLKEVRLRPKTDVHDRDYKTKHAREFLVAGDRVQFTILFRGREMAHQDIGMQRLHDIAAALTDISKVELAPKMAGKRMTMVLMPIKKGGPKAEGSGHPADAAAAHPAALPAAVGAAPVKAAPAAPPAAPAPPAPASPAVPPVST